MVKRFFFDRIDMSRDNFPVDMRIELSFLVLPDTANSVFRVCDLALVTTEKTGHLLLWERPVEHGFFNHLDY
jgi:hypothetical protein